MLVARQRFIDGAVSRCLSDVRVGTRPAIALWGGAACRRANRHCASDNQELDRLWPLCAFALGAGQTFLEGIADYDSQKQFDIPQTDLGIMRQEAEWYRRPEYGLLLFGPDGIKRERMRMARGLAVVVHIRFGFSA